MILFGAVESNQNWISELDPISKFKYYFKAASNEYRWEAPPDDDEKTDRLGRQEQHGQDWLDEQNVVVLLARSNKEREIGGFDEMRDALTKRTYYLHKSTLTVKVRGRVAPGCCCGCCCCCCC
jgi:hypothetical protein